MSESRRSNVSGLPCPRLRRLSTHIGQTRSAAPYQDAESARTSQTFSQICQKRLRRPPLETHHTIAGAPEHDNLSSPWLFSVVGVTATARNRGLQELPEPAIYVPYKMATTPGVAFLLKTDLDPLSVAHAARQRLRSVDGGLPVTQVRTLEEYLSRFERAYPRFSMTLFTIFATLGFLLAATGLFSIVS